MTTTAPSSSHSSTAPSQFTDAFFSILHGLDPIPQRAVVPSRERLFCLRFLALIFVAPAAVLRWKQPRARWARVQGSISQQLLSSLKLRPKRKAKGIWRTRDVPWAWPDFRRSCGGVASSRQKLRAGSSLGLQCCTGEFPGSKKANSFDKSRAPARARKADPYTTKSEVHLK